jgi:hypothetical protein
MKDKKRWKTLIRTFDYEKLPIVEIVNEIILDAVKRGASDIHFDPMTEFMKVRIRVDGELGDYTTVPNTLKKNLITRIKIISGMNITEVRLPQDGSDRKRSLKVPVSISGTYYLTIKHRNSIETTSASPLVISPHAISYDFTSSAAQAFGSNQKRMPQAYSAIFSGDVNQDGIVDTGDMNEIDNASTIFLMGYNAADINGDGIVDTSDMNIVDNNSASITTVQLP